MVERFDRDTGPDGRPRRLHHEDFCQALGIPPLTKYENVRGPSIAMIVDTLQRYAAGRDALAFIERVAVNVLLGNYDAHGKNIGLLYAADGIRLAPIYDVLATVVYGEFRSDPGHEHRRTTTVGPTDARHGGSCWRPST